MVVVVVDERVIGKWHIERFLCLLALQEVRSKHVAIVFEHADGCRESFRSQVLLYCAACALIELLVTSNVRLTCLLYSERHAQPIYR